MDQFNNDMGLGYNFNSLTAVMAGRRKQEYLNQREGVMNNDTGHLDEQRVQQFETRIMPVLKAYQAAHNQLNDKGNWIGIFTSKSAGRIDTQLKLNGEVIALFQIRNQGFDVAIASLEEPRQGFISCEGALREFGRILAGKEREFLDIFKQDINTRATAGIRPSPLSR